MMVDTGRTRELFGPLIQRPTLSDQLLQRPPFKFIHDIVTETQRATGYPDAGLFTHAELDASVAGASRDNKVAFLQKLIDVLNVDGHLDEVKPAKIVAGKEPEFTNLLLQSLASEAGVHMREKKAAKKAASKSKMTSASTSSTTKGGSKRDNNKKEEKAPSSKSRSKKDDESGTERKRSKSKDAKKEADKTTTTASKDKERRKKRADSSKTTAANAQNNVNDVIQQSPQIIEDVYNKTEAHETRTPPDRESSGGTSKGGDDSGIAETETTGAESERHDSERYSVLQKAGISSTPDFIEVHPSSSSPAPLAAPPVRPGTAMGRPQTAIGRPGTAVARPAPPKPKKNIISTAAVSGSTEDDKPASTAVEQQIPLLLEAEEEAKKAQDNFLVEEDEEDQLLNGANLASGDGANVAKLQQEGGEHGVLVNRIVENTRKLEAEHMQEEGPFVETDTVDVHEQRRLHAEIEQVQRALQRATQGVQPLVRTLEFVADDFDAMLRELDDCRKQRAALERALQERSHDAHSQSAQLDAALRTIDADIRDTREQLASTTATVLSNERKIAALLPPTKQ